MVRKAKALSHFGSLMLLLVLNLQVRAQLPQKGNNAVWNGHVSPSAAYIDASPFYSGSGLDICQVLSNILTCTTQQCTPGYVPYPSSGAVIDARGIIVQKTLLPLACSTNPFSGVTYPSTVLLPATRIAIQTTWTLPSNTRIIGGGHGVTQLEIPTSGFPGTVMIQMCPGTVACTGVAIEHLRLIGQDLNHNSYAIDGIDNIYAQDGSYVNDVAFAKFGALSMTGTIVSECSHSGGTVNGLCVGPNATYSGPYTNLGFSGSSNCASNTDMCLPTACAKIQAQTRGLHGITCTGPAHAVTDGANWPRAAIYLDSYNTTVENVHVEGFFDAVVLGDYADGECGKVSGDLVSNITGASGAGQVQNTVHICNPQSQKTFTGACTAGACTPSILTLNTIAIHQVLSNGGGSGGFVASTVQDDNMPWQSAVNASGSQAYVGLYETGNSFTIGSVTAYSRLTTSSGSTIPTWGAGSGAVSGPCANGSVYSNTSTTSGATIYVCSGGSWAPVK